MKQIGSVIEIEQFADVFYTNIENLNTYLKNLQSILQNPRHYQAGAFQRLPQPDINFQVLQEFLNGPLYIAINLDPELIEDFKNASDTLGKLLKDFKSNSSVSPSGQGLVKNLKDSVEKLESIVASILEKPEFRVQSDSVSSSDSGSSYGSVASFKSSDVDFSQPGRRR